jgi:hypothetical protein
MVGFRKMQKELEFYIETTTGGAGGIRTPYLLTASQTLSQLSYSPTQFKNIAKQLGKLKSET